MISMRSLFFSLGCFLCVQTLHAERLKVAVLHPILTEWIEKLGGDAVEVVNVLPAKMNPHDFSPTPKDMITLQEQDVIVAMGKHLEPYLDRVRENIPSSVQIIEAGRRVPSVKVDPKFEAFACCPRHTHGAIDPHWWHDPNSVSRAVRALGREFENLLPEQRSQIRSTSKEIRDALEDLHQWASSELAAIPPHQRKLVTAHAAFGYFCKEYRFVAIPVAGLSNEGQPTPEFLAETIQLLRENKVRALFPEKFAGAASLQAIHEETGITIATPLYADFLPRSPSDTYESMFISNVTNIVAHLGDQPSQ